MERKKYCILDMDGTIIDSMPYWNTLSPDYLREKGLEGSFDDLPEKLKAMMMPEACAYLKKEYGLSESTEEILEQLSDVMRRRYEQDIPLKKGVRDYLAALKKEGSELCIVTATAPSLVRLCLQRLGVWDLFSFVLSCEEVGYGKERPEVFLEAARRLGAEPKEIAVYEDSFVALRTAGEAGFYTVAVYDPYSGCWEESLQIADEAIEDWTSQNRPA